jgi:acyl-CoA thioesterase
VSVVRDGGNYSVRRIDVSQGLERSKICFTAICSFKRPEEKFLDLQPPKRDLLSEYSKLLDGKKVHELPLKSKFKDFRAAYEKPEPSLTTIFPGMWTSILPFEKYHADQDPIDRKCLYIYSAVPQSESKDASVKATDTDDNPALWAAAHMFHSDRESIWSVVRQFELLDILRVASSLSHTVTFHGGPDVLRFYDKKTGKPRWFFLETSADRVSDGRVMHHGHIYDQDGVLVATTIQDGAIKLNFGSEEERLKRQKALSSGSKL